MYVSHVAHYRKVWKAGIGAGGVALAYCALCSTVPSPGETERWGGREGEGRREAREKKVIHMLNTVPV